MLTRRPVLGGCLALAIIGLLGFPPFGLFASELGIARAGFDADLGWQTASVFVALAVASAALLFQAQRLLLGPPATTAPTSADAPRATLLVPLVCGLVALGVLGVTIWPIQRLLDAAARVIAG
jgi:hydrogenase-4 component F